MKSKDKTKQKKHESTIGKIIYGFLLFMPLLAIGVTCAYAIFNKNAYQSYYGETINEEQYTFTDNLQVGKSYRLTLPSNNLTIHNSNGGNRNTFIEVSNFEVLENTSPSNINNTKYISFYSQTNSLSFGVYFFEDISAGSSELAQISNSTSNSITISFTIVTKSSLIDTFFAGNNNIFYQVEYNSNSFVSEVFYYSIDKVEQSPLFNWAENSAIYTGMTATCNALDISTTFIPLLMTYWLIISVIYFLYDIILIILHVFHRKIHELEESI